MRHPRLAERLYGAPLMMMPDKAFIIESVFAAYQEGDEAKLPKWEPEREHAALAVQARRQEAGYSLTQAGVAIVPMMGSLVQRAGGLDALSGITGYNRVTAMLDAALRDPLVRGIVMDVDSPGGEVAGAFDLAAFVADAGKPVYAVANELAASAAYLIASSAQRLYLPSTAIVGSIGVLMLHQDRSEVIAKSGVRYTPIFAGAKKMDGASIAPLSEGARMDLQARVDDVYAQFVAAVADRRDLDEDDVRATEGGTMTADAAVRDGFADRVGTLTDAINAMQAEVSRPTFSFTPRASAERKDSMTTQSKQEAPAAANATAEQLATARAEGVAEGRAQAEKDLATRLPKEGSKAERARIAAILACDEAKERPTAAHQVAMHTEMPVEAAAAFLAGMPKEAPAAAGNALDKMMRGTNPVVGADAEREHPKAGARLSSVSIFERRAKAAQAR